MARYYKTFLFFLLFLVSGMQGCTQLSTNEKLLQTTFSILDAIKNTSTGEFKGKLAVEMETLAKNDEMLDFDIKKLNGYYKQYIGTNKPVPIIDTNVNQLGQKKVSIIFYKKKDGDAADHDIILELYFGPPGRFPLNKISGYNIKDTFID